MTFLKSVLFLVCLLFSIKTAFAAGIDCKQARTEFDKTICNSSDLLERDKNLTAAYESLKNKLSPEAQEDFKTGQKTWLSFVRSQCNAAQIKKEKDAQKVCGDDAGCVSAAYDNQADCIRGEYNTRIGSLVDALKNSKDGFLIVKSSLNGVYPPEEDDDVGNAGINISYPQIYIPYSEGIKKMNSRRTIPSAGTGDYDCQHNSNYTIAMATPHLVSFESSTDWYCKGMTHGNGNSDGYTIKLPSAEALKADDVFIKGSHWEDALSKMASESVIEKIDAPCTEVKNVATPEKLKPLVIDPHRWILLPDKLTIIFNSYDISSYACSPDGPDISWEQLKPYLRKDFLAELDSANHFKLPP